MGNKVALALSVLAIAIVMSACGGTQGSNIASNTAPTVPQPPRGRQPRTDPRKSCDKQGVNRTQLRVGPCTEDGVQYVVANYGGVLAMRSMKATVLEFSVSGGNGQTLIPQYDALLRVTLQVQNRSNKPQRWGLGQTMLGIAASNYLERVDLERRALPEALATKNGGVVQPGEVVRGSVLFDITRADYDVLDREGRFFMWNFGGRAAPQFRRGVGQVGQIRLYAGERQ